MFHRRLLLLAVAMVAVLFALGTATTMLATGQSHADAKALAESKLSRQHIIQTKRGAILDRNGRVLAEDEPGWELAIHFDLLTGKWGYKQAIADASKDKLAWSEMSQAEREKRVGELQLEYEQQVDELFRTLAERSGTPLAELQERRSDVVQRVDRMQSYLWELWRKQEEKERGEPVSLSEVAQPIKAQTEHHVMLGDMSETLRLQFEQFIDEGKRALEGDEQARPLLPWTMVQLRRATVRRYRSDIARVELDRSTLPGPLANDEPITIEVSGVGLHIVGQMRDVWKEDVGASPLLDRKGRFQLAGYADGDRLGRSGIEQSMERSLRGSRGLRTVSLTTGQTMHEIEPRAGRDVTLTIDIRLQAQIQAIMSPEFGLMKTLPWHLKTDDPQDQLGTPLNGSAVVMDIATGDVLAAVSVPSASRELLREDPDLLWNDAINNPMLNRTVSVPYQPGSTLKTLVAAAALTDNVLGINEKVDTPGHLWKDPTVYRDWIFKLTGWQSFNDLNGGPIDVIYAIARSSNVFFGKMAERLIKRHGLERLPWWYEQFGMGQKTGIGLPEELDGFLGVAGQGEAKYEHNQVCFMAIGQGPVAWTPLQAATAYSRQASGDLTRRARLIQSPALARNDDSAKPAPPKISPAVRRAILEGMRQSANERIGTTHHISHGPSGLSNVLIFNVEGVTVMAKSGTADPGSRRWIDFNRDGKIDEGEIEKNPRDHAWVTALVQPDGADAPTHAIACVVEYAGSGGRVAGPIVNQIIHALKRHGYLD